MGIVNYQIKAERSKERLFRNPSISSKNKEYVKEFLDSYDVTDATKDIFLCHIIHLLEKSKDIKLEMQDKKLINSWYAQLRQQLGRSAYSTMLNRSLTFIRWLNDKETPVGFKDLKSVGSNKIRRELSPSDMITWDDAKKMASQTTSIQLKALIYAQLDGGFRPSEFIDLNYGDAEKSKDVIIIHIRNGKTGKRDVLLYDAGPMLNRWLMAHPTKRKDDPLWIQESNTGGRILRYQYPAISKRIRDMASKAGVQKPMELYAWRHSAVTLKKKENMDATWSSGNFGHSMKFYAETYGRLSTEDNIERLRRHKGALAEKESQKETSLLCPKCEHINPSKFDMCEQCGTPLSLKKAMELDRTPILQKDIEVMKAQLVKMNTFMNTISAEHPEILEMIARAGKKNR